MKIETKAGRPSKNIIYGIADKNNTIVYVGKTKHFDKRKLCYTNANSCHNVLLKEWLEGNEWHFIILEENPTDINESEKYFIKKYKETLFNMVSGGDQNWRSHKRDPWMAKTGVLCPSGLCLRYLNNRGNYKTIKNEITAMRDKMSTKERVIYEVTLAKNLYDSFTKEIELWLSYTEQRLLKELM